MLTDPCYFSSCTGWAQTFKSNLLSADDKALVRTLRHRYGHIRQTVRAAAIGAGKMWVALTACAIAGQLKVPRPLVEIRFVYKLNFEQTGQRAIDRNLVEVL